MEMLDAERFGRLGVSPAMRAAEYGVQPRGFDGGEELGGQSITDLVRIILDVSRRPLR